MDKSYRIDLFRRSVAGYIEKIQKKMEVNNEHKNIRQY